MLQSLHIENVAVVKRLDIEFSAGMTALTGETGAGKSVMIDCLGLITGGKSQREMIRTGAERAMVSAVFTDVRLPESLREAGIEPDENGEIEKLAKMSYPERAATVLSKFLTDYTYDELLADCKEAYSEARFPGGAAPIRAITEQIHALELWHGPTCAFKDMALQIMPRLLSRALVKTGEERTALILVATSGDTGKAALEGYCDIDRVRIQVFYPVNGVSNIQKKQMASQKGKNVKVVAINGNFDDAQSGVKKIFADENAKKMLSIDMKILFMIRGFYIRYL